LGPSPLGLETIFYCLRFETSLFVASYNSQGHGEGIQPRLHMGLSELYYIYLFIYLFMYIPLSPTSVCLSDSLVIYST
jgi:hypothetical protein